MKRVLVSAVLFFAFVSPGQAVVVFNQPHNGTGTLLKTSWFPPDGTDSDTYRWDGFTLASNTAITEIHWRGGYEYHPSGTGQSPVSDFEVAIYRSSVNGTQPDLGPGGRLVRYFTGGNAGETAAGSFGGVALFDYAFVLPSPFQAAGGETFWVYVVASQGAVPPSWAPDWGFAVGTGGNNLHLRNIRAGGLYQMVANDLAFSLVASDAPGVTINASASPAGAGTVSGAGSYPIGSTASLTALPNAGWGFVDWTEGGATVSTNPNYSFTAAVNRTLVANFVPAYTITTSSYPDYAGTITGGGVYNEGATVTLVATPNPGFVFTGWSDGVTTATNSFPAAYDLMIAAFFVSAPWSVTYDFDSGPVGSSFPLDLTVDGLTAHFTGNYSIQAANTIGFTPVGFSGNCVYPNSVFQSDLGVAFSERLTAFSILYAPQEIGCDTSALMRATAYMDGVFVATNTMVAPQPGIYPTATLTVAAPGGFNSVVVHWVSPGLGCQDYGPIFLADIVTVTRDSTQSAVGENLSPVVTHLAAPTPNPLQRSATIRFELAKPGPVRLDVYDVAGRLVRPLVDERLDGGAHTATWNGTDRAGRAVSAGLYVVSLRSAGFRESRRVVVVR